MALELNVLSDAKGSNPGGLARITNGRDNFDVYFKYVYGSKIPVGFSNLKSDHQPVYEAITFELARRLGLSTPSFFVLLNDKNDVKFNYGKNVSKKKHSGRLYYFISKIIKESSIDKKQLNEIGNTIVEEERPYLEMLQIDDILGVRQNYLVDSANAKVFYIDLGCSFVHAKEGFIYFPSRSRKINHNEKRNKKGRCQLKRKNVIKLDNVGELINLEGIVSNFRNLMVPTLNPFGRKKISDLISIREIEEVEDYIRYGFCNNLKSLEERKILIIN